MIEAEMMPVAALISNHMRSAAAQHAYMLYCERRPMFGLRRELYEALQQVAAAMMWKRWRTCKDFLSFLPLALRSHNSRSQYAAAHTPVLEFLRWKQMELKDKEYRLAASNVLKDMKGGSILLI